MLSPNRPAFQIRARPFRAGIVAICLACSTVGGCATEENYQSFLNGSQTTQKFNIWNDVIFPVMMPIAERMFGPSGSVLFTTIAQIFEDNKQRSQQAAVGGSSASARSLEMNPNVVPTLAPRQIAAGLALQLVQVDKTNRAVNRFSAENVTFKTGDAFVIEVLSNLPGNLTVINTDVEGEDQQLGTYYLRAGATNRIPATGAIEIFGETGTEYLQLSFVSCRDYVGGADVAARSMRLRESLEATKPVPDSPGGAFGGVAPVVLDRMNSCAAVSGSSAVSPKSMRLTQGGAAEETSEGGVTFVAGNVQNVPNDGAIDVPPVSYVVEVEHVSN